jgi:hypothetical protein
MSHLTPDKALDLSVHSLPDSAALNPRVVMTGRLKLLAILFLCSMPVLLAYFAYYVVRPQGAASYGELITPLRELPLASGFTLNGSEKPLATLKAQWLLIKVDGGACLQDCQKQLVLLRQFRLMLGKDMDRIDWVWMVNDQQVVAADLSQALKKDQATVLRVDPVVLQNWLIVPAGKSQTDYFFVIDPMGNAMMRLPVRFDSSAITKAKRDMEHLLRASLPWDPPGR